MCRNCASPKVTSQYCLILRIRLNYEKYREYMSVIIWNRSNLCFVTNRVSCYHFSEIRLHFEYSCWLGRLPLASAYMLDNAQANGVCCYQCLSLFLFQSHSSSKSRRRRHTHSVQRSVSPKHRLPANISGNVITSKGTAGNTSSSATNVATSTVATSLPSTNNHNKDLPVSTSTNNRCKEGASKARSKLRKSRSKGLTSQEGRLHKDGTLSDY